jgi:hypothetical protein
MARRRRRRRRRLVLPRPGADYVAPGKNSSAQSSHNRQLEKNNNEENSPTFDRRVSPLVSAATQESNVWVLSVKGRKKEK